MKKFFKRFFLTVSVVLGLFWAIGYFSVPEDEHGIILSVAAATEAIPVVLWRIMAFLIKKDERRREAADIRKSVPIWEKENNNETESSAPQKDLTEKSVKSQVMDGGEKEENKAESESGTPVEENGPDRPQQESPAPETNRDESKPDVQTDQPEEKEEVIEPKHTEERSVSIVPDQEEELKAYVDRAVSEASLIQGVLSALRIARAPFQVTKAVLTMVAFSCQDYETDHPMHGILLPMETGDFEDKNTVFMIRQKVEEYLLATGTQDVYTELYGILLGFAATSCSSTTYKPFLKQWLEQNGSGHGLSPFPEARRLASDKGRGVGLVYALRSFSPVV